MFAWSNLFPSITVIQKVKLITYLRALNVLKFLSHPKHVCNHKILLPLCITLVRSILDYGFRIYTFATPSHLKLFNPIQNAALRLAMDAFRTSPTISSYSEAGTSFYFTTGDSLLQLNFSPPSSSTLRLPPTTTSFIRFLCI